MKISTFILKVTSFKVEEIKIKKKKRNQNSAISLKVR